MNDNHCGPRAIFIEIHPYVWPQVGTTGDSIIGLLTGCGYNVFDLDLNAIANVNLYGHIIALKGQR
jgi:hypothetical protein